MEFFRTLKRDPLSFLRGVLRANATFSILSGIVMIAGGARLGAWLGKAGSVALDGVVLLMFAAVILWITRAETVGLKVAGVIVALDAVYVVDTVRQILTGQFSTAGNWFYGIVTLVVLDFAILQLSALLEAARQRSTARACYEQSVKDEETDGIRQ